MSDLLSEIGRLTEVDEEAESAWDAKLAEINGRGPAEPDTHTEAETPEESDTVETTGQPRDEHGRFARVETPEVDEHSREAELEAEEQAAEQPTDDDPVERLLAKYNGDVGAALKAAADAQALIGRKESERSAAEQELQELRARLEQLEQGREQQPQVARPITEADIERLDTMAMSSNPADARAAIEEAGRLDPTGMLSQRVYETWASVSPGPATAFLADQIAEAKLAALREELAPIRAQTKESAENAAFVNVWNRLTESRPEVEKLVPAMTQILDENEPLARTILQADDETKFALLGTLADAARARQEPHVQEAIAQFEAERSAASREAKTAAAVLPPKTAVGSPPGGGVQGEKSQAQQEAEAIKARLLEAPDTSISSGWTTE